MSNRSSTTLGLVQINCQLGNPTANLKRAEELMSGLAGRAHLACLPELFSTGYNLEALGADLFDLAEEIPGSTTKALSALARKMKMGIVAGIVERDPSISGWIYISVVLINQAGDLVGVYRKSHLFPSENRYFRAGNELPVFELDGLKVGVAICYELAFPPIFSTLALRGAQVILNPSAVPVGFEYLQDVRTPARAQDNQVCVAVVNHVGNEGGKPYCGESQAFDQKGRMLAKATSDQEEALCIEVSFDLMLRERHQEPNLRVFRPELYQFTGD